MTRLLLPIAIHKNGTDQFTKTASTQLMLRALSSIPIRVMIQKPALTIAEKVHTMKILEKHLEILSTIGPATNNKIKNLPSDKQILEPSKL
jgi:hypothetical protein